MILINLRVNARIGTHETLEKASMSLFLLSLNWFSSRRERDVIRTENWRGTDHVTEEICHSAWHSAAAMQRHDRFSLGSWEWWSLSMLIVQCSHLMTFCGKSAMKLKPFFSQLNGYDDVCFFTFPFPPPCCNTGNPTYTVFCALGATQRFFT